MENLLMPLSVAISVLFVLSASLVEFENQLSGFQVAKQTTATLSGSSGPPVGYGDYFLSITKVVQGKEVEVEVRNSTKEIIARQMIPEGLTGTFSGQGFSVRVNKISGAGSSAKADVLLTEILPQPIDLYTKSVKLDLENFLFYIDTCVSGDKFIKDFGLNEFPIVIEAKNMKDERDVLSINPQPPQEGKIKVNAAVMKNGCLRYVYRSTEEEKKFLKEKKPTELRLIVDKDKKIEETDEENNEAVYRFDYIPNVAGQLIPIPKPDLHYSLDASGEKYYSDREKKKLTTAAPVEDGIGGSYKFDGNDQIVLDTHTREKTTYTVSLWFKTGSTSGSPVIFMRGKANGCRYNPGVHIQSNKLVISETDCNKMEDLEFKPGEWNNVIISRNSNANNVNIYVNGRQQKSLSKGNYERVFPNSVSVLGAGLYDGTKYTNYFKGKIDEVNIWNIDLSKPQAIALYENQKSRIVEKEDPTVSQPENEVSGGGSSAEVPGEGIVEEKEDLYLKVSRNYLPETKGNDKKTVVGFSASATFCINGKQSVKELGLKDMPVSIFIPDNSLPDGFRKFSLESLTQEEINSEKSKLKTEATKDQFQNWAYVLNKNADLLRNLKSWTKENCIPLTYTFGENIHPDILASYRSSRELYLIIDPENKASPADVDKNYKKSLYCKDAYCRLVQSSFIQFSLQGSQEKAPSTTPSPVPEIQATPSPTPAGGGGSGVGVTGPVPTNLKEVDLELRSVKINDETSGTFNLEVCNKESKSIKEIRPGRSVQILLKVTRLNSTEPYNVRPDLTGLYPVMLDLKGGQCTSFALTLVETLYRKERAAYLQSKKIEIIVDPDEEISETEEKNNKASCTGKECTMEKPPVTPTPSPATGGGGSGVQISGGPITLPPTSSPSPSSTPAPTQPPTCTDSDGDDRGLVTGTTTFEGKIYIDSCVSDTQAWEHTCNTPYTKGLGGYNCPAGKSCKDGACTGTASPTPIKTSTTPIATPLPTPGIGLTGSPSTTPTGQQYRIETVAGDGTVCLSYAQSCGDDGLATSAKLAFPAGIVLDSSGNLYIADSSNNRIRKVDSSGKITIIANSETRTAGYSGDGDLATKAKLSSPEGVAVDSSGNIYVADSGNSRIRKIDTKGIITLVAGAGGNGFSGDGGPAIDAKLNFPRSIAVSPQGDLYIADTSNNRIRKVDSSGKITTIAGTGLGGYSGDGGPATSAQLYTPRDLSLDSQGNLYIADTNTERIRKIDKDGIITTIAGKGVRESSGDGGLATNAQIHQPHGVTVDSSGNLYITERWTHKIRKVDAKTGIITTIAGTGTAGYNGDSKPAVEAQLNEPNKIASDRLGNIYVSEAHRVRKIYLLVAQSPIPTSTTLTIPTPQPTCTDSDGGKDLYTKGTASKGDRKGTDTCYSTGIYEGVCSSTGEPMTEFFVCPSGCFNGACIKPNPTPTPATPTVSVVVGGGFGASTDGVLASTAKLNVPRDVAVDRSGNIYIADTGNYKIRKIFPADTGTYKKDSIYNIVGTQSIQAARMALDNLGDIYFTTQSYPYEIKMVDIYGNMKNVVGPSINYMVNGYLSQPVGIAVDQNSNIFIADFGSNSIKKVFLPQTGKQGRIVTIAGVGTTIPLLYPTGIAVDMAGRVYVSGSNNKAIKLQAVVENGLVSEEKYEVVPGWPESTATFFQPMDIAANNQDLNYNVYVSDSYNNRIVKIDKFGKVTVLTTAGDQVYMPEGISVDSLGNVYFTEPVSHKVRKVSSQSSTIPCADSDGGKIYDKRGSATGAYITDQTGASTTRTDYCSGSYVYEHFCENNKVNLVPYNCQGGCKDGECFPSTSTDLNLYSGWITSSADKIILNAYVCVLGSKSTADYNNAYTSSLLNKQPPATASQFTELSYFPLTWTIINAAGEKAPIKSTFSGSQGNYPSQIKSGQCSVISYELPYQSIKDSFNSQKRLDIEIGHLFITESDMTNNKLYCSENSYKQVGCSTIPPTKTDIVDLVTSTAPSQYFIARGVRYGIYMSNTFLSQTNPSSNLAFLNVVDGTGKSILSVGGIVNPPASGDLVNIALAKQNLGFSIKVLNIQAGKATIAITREY